ncbi:2TM domain-containing protein [Maribacter vaceletii]|uniref:2TM domain-containing protein n=1 Tax=Maribacter vaceletii TaxID=1206816 RepID=A0A495DTC2_9FLAO|nr:2TM domain-containing protein [Maribacter vaceletii]RKR07892.1 2TM domain-containing protein [Maribacter vaceletii]
MERRNIKAEKYEKAMDRVKTERKFYLAIVRLFIFSILLFFLNDSILQLFIDRGLDNEHIVYWVNWSLWCTPVIIAIILFIKGIWLFGFKNKSPRKWEERRIKKIMREEDSFKKLD